MRVHAASEIESFKCDCGRSFTDRNELLSHQQLQCPSSLQESEPEMTTLNPVAPQSLVHQHVLLQQRPSQHPTMIVTHQAIVTHHRLQSDVPTTMLLAATTARPEDQQPMLLTQRLSTDSNLTVETSYQCQLCSVQCSSKPLLKAHQATHNFSYPMFTL